MKFEVFSKMKQATEENVKVKSKFDRYTLLSAFQKDIRRCNTNALYWTNELTKITLFQSIWDKMKVIASEDIGIASPEIQTYIAKQFELQHGTKKNVEKKRILLETVMTLVTQNKSRLCDNINHAYFKDTQPELETESDESDNYESWFKAFKRGLMNKDLEETLKYACYLYKKEKEDRIMSELVYPNNEHVDVLSKLFYKYNKTMRNKTDVLFMVHIILYRINEGTKSICLVPPPEYSTFTLEEMEQIESQSVLTIPDYAYDKHTCQGRVLNRGYKHFYEVSALLNQNYILDEYEQIAKALNCAKDSE